MAIGKVIYNILANDVDVSSLVSTRIYPNFIDYNSTSMPAIVYTEVDNDPTNTKTSVSQLDQSNILISCFAETYSQMNDLAEKVRIAFESNYGTEETNSSIQVQSIEFTDSQDMFDDEYGQYGINYKQLNFKIRIKRSITSSDTIMIFDTRIQGDGSSPTNQLTLHFAGSENDCVVDWGDGSTTIIPNAAELTHTYTTPGIKKVTFSGNRVQIKYDASITSTSAGRRDAYKLLEIQNWGIFNLYSDSMFEGCKNMTITATDIPTISSSSFSNMFAWCFKMEAPSTMNDWDLSSVTSLSSVFYYCSRFNTYINDWDVSNVTSFQSCFNNCSNFNQSLSNWDVSNGYNFSYMFLAANQFNSDVTTWQFRTDGSINFLYMFGQARIFNQDVSNWNTERVTNMQQMFYQAYPFNQNLNSWNMSNVTTVYRMLRDLDWYDQPMDNWDVSNITVFKEFMANSDALSTSNYDALLISWGSQDVSLNEQVSFGSSQYTPGAAAEAARTFLITNKGWTITDGGAA